MHQKEKRKNLIFIIYFLNKYNFITLPFPGMISLLVLKIVTIVGFDGQIRLEIDRVYIFLTEILMGMVLRDDPIFLGKLILQD